MINYKSSIDEMINSGLEIISCGAHEPFADKEIFFGSIMEHTDDKESLIADFISNYGMGGVFAYFMECKVQMTDKAIFSDASNRIKGAMKEIYNKNKCKTGISATTFEIALKHLI